MVEPISLFITTQRIKMNNHYYHYRYLTNLSIHWYYKHNDTIIINIMNFTNIIIMHFYYTIITSLQIIKCV